jgi:hypothetical protein
MDLPAFPVVLNPPPRSARLPTKAHEANEVSTVVDSVTLFAHQRDKWRQRTVFGYFLPSFGVTKSAITLECIQPFYSAVKISKVAQLSTTPASADTYFRQRVFVNQPQGSIRPMLLTPLRTRTAQTVSLMPRATT